MTESTSELRPGRLLLTPADAGERARDVLCVVDEDPEEPGAFFALLLNRPTDQPAQPLAFSLFDCRDDVLWFGGPTNEPFALVEFTADAGHDAVRPDGSPRPFITDRTALFMPGRDHPPAIERIRRRRVFQGSIWLSPPEANLYRDKGLVLTATDHLIYDTDPDTLAERLRECAASRG